jgi:ComF family protein
VRAKYFFEGVVRQAIHLFKYRGARYLLATLSSLLLESVEPQFLESDAVVPVPLHRDRLKERSYNQSQLLATEVSKTLGIILADNYLIRTRSTEPQMQLPAERRTANVRGAFSCVDRSLDGKNVLLVDDVFTTGATLNECAIALKKAGVAGVWAVCIARAR